MFSSRNAGKFVLYSKCSCVPGFWTERIYQRFFVAEAHSDSAWDYLKSKLGLQKKKNKPNITEEISSEEHQVAEIPVNPNSAEELWKPGYRGRTENKRYYTSL